MKALVRNSDGVVIDISANEFPKMNVATWINCLEDVQIGWIYLENNFIDTNLTSEPIPAIEQLRGQRDGLLSSSDWRDLPSYPGADQEAWRTYRQQLRDLPANSSPSLDENGMLTNVTWPTPPSE